MKLEQRELNDIKLQVIDVQLVSLKAKIDASDRSEYRHDTNIIMESIMLKAQINSLEQEMSKYYA